MKTVQKVSEVVSSVIIKTLKIALLNLFKSERDRLKPFLLQVRCIMGWVGFFLGWVKMGWV